MRRCGSATVRGFESAQYNLGVKYDLGKGVPQDFTEAVNWYRKAADQGQSDAQNNLGQLYRNDQGVPQDYVQAHMWLNLAASRYSASEKEGRENAINGRDFVASKMTPSQIAEAQKLARDWKPRASGERPPNTCAPLKFGVTTRGPFPSKLVDNSDNLGTARDFPLFLRAQRNGR